MWECVRVLLRWCCSMLKVSQFSFVSVELAPDRRQSWNAVCYLIRQGGWLPKELPDSDTPSNTNWALLSRYTWQSHTQAIVLHWRYRPTCLRHVCEVSKTTRFPCTTRGDHSTQHCCCFPDMEAIRRQRRWAKGGRERRRVLGLLTSQTPFRLGPN